MGYQTLSKTSQCLPSSRISCQLPVFHSFECQQSRLKPSMCPQLPAPTLRYLTGTLLCFLLSLHGERSSGSSPRTHSPSEAGPSFLFQRLRVLCVGLWFTGDQKNKIYHLTVVFFFLSIFFFFPRKNEASTSPLCSERASNMAGHRQKHILLLRGKECNR